MNSFSLWKLFTTDIVTAIASIVLVVFSVLSWAVIVEKIRLFRAFYPHSDATAVNDLFMTLMGDW